MLPSLPSNLTGWVQPGAWGAITSLLAVNWLETKASEARQVKRTDELINELKASEARQAKRTDELRADNRSLGEKMDQMLNALLAARKT